MSHSQIPADIVEPTTSPSFTVDQSSWAFGAQHSDRSDTQRTVSCVIWSSNEALKLSRLLPQLSELLTESGHPWEIVVID